MRLFFIALVWTLSPCGALAQSDQDWKLCEAEDADAAIPACTRLLETGKLDDKNRTRAYDSRGVGYWREGNYDRAIADYTKAIQIDPQYARAYMRRGAAYAGKSDYDRSLADSTMAIELDPKNFKAYGNRALAYAHKDDFDRAIFDYTKLIEINPGEARAYEGRGSAYERKGRYDAAVADYAQVMEFDPKNFTYARSLGLMKFLTGDFRGASSDLARAFELRSDIYVTLFLYLARKRAGESAETELEANAKQLPIKVWPYALAELYLGKRSAAQLLAAETTRNFRCQTQFYVGEWYVLNGNTEEGLMALDAAAESCPKDLIEGKAAVAELKRLKP